MGSAGSTLESFMINWMLKVGWLKGNDLYEFGRLPKMEAAFSLMVDQL